jgi:hypothetical protein
VWNGIQSISWRISETERGDRVVVTFSFLFGEYRASNAVSDFLYHILPHMDIGHAVTVVNFYVMITIFYM